MDQGSSHSRSTQHGLVPKDPIAPKDNDKILVAHLGGSDHDDGGSSIQEGRVVVPRLSIAIE